MANPPNAVPFTQPMDPADIIEWQVNLSQGSVTGGEYLMAGENVAAFTVAASAEAAAAGLTIMTSARAPSLSGLVITFWLTVSSGMQSSPVFDGAGLSLGVIITVTTDSSPPRTRQSTVVVPVAQQ